MNKKPYIAINLAVYNGGLWLQEQVLSIFNQENINIKIFISTDPSTDNTEALCQQLAQQDSRITVLPNIGKFGGAAPNFFRLLRDVDFSDFNYVAFSDQDDIWNYDKLSTAIEILKQQQCDGYSSNFTAFWPDGRVRFP